MNVERLKADLGALADRLDPLPVLVWADGQWMTLGKVLPDEDRVILMLRPFDPWPDDSRGKRPIPEQGWEEPELPLT